MLFCDKAAAATDTTATTADAGKIRFGGGYRPAASTADAGKIRLGGGYRPAATTVDTGKVRLGGGYRLVTPRA